MPIANKRPSLPPWQIFCGCLNAKPNLHTCSIWSRHQPSKPGGLQGFHARFPKCWLQQRRLCSWLLQGRAVGSFSWIMLAWIHAEFGIMGLQRYERFISVNFSHFPYDRTQRCFCKSKISAQQMVSIRKCFLCQLHNHMSPKLPFKSSEGLF